MLDIKHEIYGQAVVAELSNAIAEIEITAGADGINCTTSVDARLHSIGCRHGQVIQHPHFTSTDNGVIVRLGTVVS
ncbi:hypothetical protein D3C77_483470 [compost metagenome]